jgi:hypothetical protein
MKIRNGFVSNSSSSSFVIRGIKITEEELQKIGIPMKNKDDIWGIRNYLQTTYGIKMSVETTRYYFGGDPTGEFIIGKEIGELGDGVVSEIPDCNDGDIIEDLKKAGILVNKLSTFIQYVSNDNY